MNLPRVVTGRRRQLLARLVLNGFAQAAATVSTAWLVREAFHLAMTAGGAGFDPQRLAAIGAGLLASAAALAWLRTEERAGAERMGQHYAEELRLTLFDVLASVPVRALQRRTRGGLALRFTGDMKALRQWVSMGLARVTVGGVIIVLSLVALAAVSGALALTAALVIGAGTAAAVALGGRTRDAMREARRRNAYLAANVGEKIASIAVVQVFNQSRRERGRLERQSDRLNEAMVLQARRSAQLRGIADFTASIASAAVLVVGALETARGALSPASVAAGMAMVGLLLPSLRDLGLAFGYWNGTQVSRRKLVEFMQSPTLRPEPEGAPDVVPGAGRIEFRDVMLEGSVSGFSAVAEGGNMVAIVGPNGSGKSSLLALAARLVDPDEGKILLDGQDLAACTLASVRKALGVVSADLPLLRGSLDMNLRYRWPKAPEYEMERVRALCEMDEMLRELPDGTKFRVQEGGANLSLGQRQRIALARALIGCPPVLLLDEADANLDGRSTAILDHVLERFPGTVLIVTHRYERAAKADVIWYVENGRLVESGSPRQLLRGNGPTARLLRPALSAVG